MNFTKEEIIKIYSIVSDAVYNEEKRLNKLIEDSESRRDLVNVALKCSKNLDALKSLKKKVTFFRDNYERL